jgi:hypothetical protein
MCNAIRFSVATHTHAAKTPMINAATIVVYVYDALSSWYISFSITTQQKTARIAVFISTKTISVKNRW